MSVQSAVIPPKLTFVCWKWKPAPGYRSSFAPQTVNVLRNMIERHYQGPHELVCVTDDPAGIDPRVRTLPLWTEFAHVPSPHGVNYPSCYRRLRMFAPDAGELFGDRFVSMDLDVVITRDITALLNTPADFRIYGDTAKGTPYNGSLIQLRAGARSKVWKEFDPKTAGQRSLRAGYIGSDQGWIAIALGPNEAKFTRKDGVYSYRNEIQPSGGMLPNDAKIVIMHGHLDPWTPLLHRKHKWIAEHYR